MRPGFSESHRKALFELTLTLIFPCEALFEQAAVAEDLKIAIGTVNGKLKILVAQGAIEVKRTQRRKIRYRLKPNRRALQ